MLMAGLDSVDDLQRLGLERYHCICNSSNIMFAH